LYCPCFPPPPSSFSLEDRPLLFANSRSGAFPPPLPPFFFRYSSCCSFFLRPLPLERGSNPQANFFFFFLLPFPFEKSQLSLFRSFSSYTTSSLGPSCPRPGPAPLRPSPACLIGRSLQRWFPFDALGLTIGSCLTPCHYYGYDDFWDVTSVGDCWHPFFYRPSSAPSSR